MFKTKTRKKYFFTKNREIIDKIASNILIDLDNVSVAKINKTIHYQIPYYNELEDALAGIKNGFTAVVSTYIVRSLNYETLVEMTKEPEKNGNYIVVLFKRNKEMGNIINKYIA